jgi:hypothetical protein
MAGIYPSFQDDPDKEFIKSKGGRTGDSSCFSVLFFSDAAALKKGWIFHYKIC